jgi:sulfur carrier protein
MSADRAGSGDVHLTVNGERQVVPSGATVGSLVAGMGVEPRGIAVAIDGEVVPRRTWPDRGLRAGEQVEILTIAQGG